MDEAHVNGNTSPLIQTPPAAPPPFVPSQAQADRIEAKLDTALGIRPSSPQQTFGTALPPAFDPLVAEVTSHTTVRGSVDVLIRGIASRFAAAGSDPAQLASVQTMLREETPALVNAVAENVPPVIAQRADTLPHG